MNKRRDVYMDNQQRGLNTEIVLDEALKQANNLTREVVLLRAYIRQLECEIGELEDKIKMLESDSEESGE